VSDENFSKISKEVNIVFHLLATVKFHETLHKAVRINILNTRKIVEISNRIENLKSFMHVSTLFSNADRSFADEIIYDHALHYQQLINIAEASKPMENQKTGRVDFQHNFPNTYTLTKHFAEKLVVSEAKNLPVGIFRPPTVMASYSHKPGWTSSINGMSGMIASLIKGYIHCWLRKQENPSDVAPVDYCANAIIAAAWDASEKFHQSNAKFSIPIYNFVLKKNDMTRLASEGFSTSFSYFSHIKTLSKYCFLIMLFLTLTGPALIMDFGSLISNQNRRNWTTSRKLKDLYLVVSPIFLNSFEFGNRNMLNLINKVENMRNANLNFNLIDIDWKRYMKTYQAGIKEYFFKENMQEERLEDLRVKYQR
jgi:alcohol-forming fatty acyl-CoA reductase